MVCAILLLAAIGMAPASAWATPPVHSQGPNFGVYSIGEVQIPLTATGGDGVNYTWSIVGGALPPGVSLRTDKDSWFPPDSSAGLIGVATTPDTYNFTLRVSSGGESADLACTLRISPLVLSSSGGAPDAFVGAIYSHALVAANNAGPVTWTATGGVPSGMSLNASGVLSGTPDTPGNYGISFSVTDGVDTLFKSVSINVSAVRITTPGVLPNATQNVPYSSTVAASGGAGGYTFFANGLPNGLNLFSNGAITGTPNAGPGNYRVNVTVQDSGANSYTKTMSLNVVGGPKTLPSVEAYNNILDDCTIGVACERPISVAFGGVAPFTWNATGLPPGTFLRTGSGVTTWYVTPGDAEVWGSPTATGLYNPIFTVTDADGKTATQTFPIRVSTLLLRQQPNGTVGVPYSNPLRVLGGAAPFTVSLTSGRLPLGLSLNTTEVTPGVFAVTGTPTESGSVVNPVYQFADSGSATLRATSFLYINPGSSTVQINHNGDLGTINQGGNYWNQVNACCAPAIAWTVVSGGLPPGVGLSAGGLLSGTPTSAGTYTFVLRAEDTSNAANYGLRQFSVVVSPLAISGNFNLPIGFVSTPYSTALTATGGAGALTWTLVAPGSSYPSNYLPPGLSLAADGTLGGTPTQSGQYRFAVTVADTASHLFTQTLSVSIYAAGTFPPVWQNQGSNFGTYSIGEVQVPLTATGGNGTYAWSKVAGVLPPGVSLRTDKDSWFPPDSSAGLIGVATTPNTYNFTLRVTSAGEDFDQASTIRIAALAVKDPNQLPDAFVNTAYTYTLTTVNDVGAVTWTPTGVVPSGMTLSSAGVLSGTPDTANFYNISFSVSDSVDTVNRNISLGVFSVKITTPGVLPNATQNVAYTTTLAASGGAGPYVFTANGLPNGLVLASNGVISGTPTNTGPGPYRVNVTAMDTSMASYSRPMSLDVIGVPKTLPSVTFDSLDDFTLGVPVNVSVSVNSGGTAPYTWAATGLPPGTDFRTGSATTPNSSPEQLEIWGTPTAVGSYNPTFTVTDAEGKTATQTFPLHVSNLLRRPNLVNGTTFVPYSSQLRILGGVGPFTVAQAGGRLPLGLSLNTTEVTPGVFDVTGTPTENGNFNALFDFADAGSGTLRATAFGFIIGGNVQINHNGFLGTITQGSFYWNTLPVCCAPSYTWSEESGTLPPGLSISSAGTLSGTPNTSGTYTFVLRAENGTNAADFGIRQFTVVVTPLSLSSNTNLPFGSVSTPYSTTLTATGGTGALTWTLAPSNADYPANYLPPGLTLAANGVLSGTPTASGQFSFALDVTDTAAHLLTRMFNISIYAAGMFPPIWQSQGPNFGTYSIGEVQIPLTATGGDGSYVWSILSGSLPPGVSLRTDKDSWFPPDSSAGLIGVATTPGTYNFTLRVTSAGVDLDQVSTIRIAALAVKDSYQLPDAFVNTAYSYTMTALNAAGPVTWTANGGLPSGMTLSSTGVLSGTPVADGFYNISFSVSDGVETVGRGTSLAVFQVRITTPGVLPNATQNVPYSTTLSASGGAGGHVFTANGLPNGLVLAQNGTISGTPNAGVGLYRVNVTATDTNQVSYNRTMSLVVIGVPKVLPGVSASELLGDCTLGVYCGRQISVIAGGTAPFTWTATGLPPGLSLRTDATSSTVFPPGGAEVWGTPTVAGAYNPTFTVTDAEGASATQTFPLRVSTLLSRPGLAYGTIFVPYSSRLRIIGGAGPFTVAQTSGRLPLGLALTTTELTTGIFPVTGTPIESGNNVFNPIFELVDFGGATLRATAYLSIGGGASTIQINHNGVLGTITTGSSYSNQLSACCVPSYTWSLTSGTLPPGLSISSGGNLSGTPNTSGAYTFVLRAEDATNAANFGNRQFSVVVSPLSVSNTTLPVGFVNTPYGTTLTATGGTGALTWTVVTPNADYRSNYLPPGLSLAGDGVLSGTPTASGKFSFAVDVTDTEAHLFTRTFSVSIYAEGTFPPIDLPLGNLGNRVIGAQTFTLSATGGSPPYTYSLTPLVTQIPGMRVQDGPPLPTSFPGGTTAGYLGVVTTPGSYSGSIRVADSQNTTFDRTVTMNVHSLQVASQTNLPKALVGTPYSFTMVGSGGSGNYSWFSSSLPSGLSISSSGVISGTPTAAGTSSPSITLTDLTLGVTTTPGHTLVVNAYEITSGPVLPPATVGTAYSQTLTAPGCGTGCSWSVIGSSLPGGLSLNSSSGLVSGTPNGTATSSFTVQVSGSNGSVRKVMSIWINTSAIQPLAILGSNPSDNTVGSLVTFNLAAQSGVLPLTWSVQSGSLPVGVTLQGPGETLGFSLIPGQMYLTGRARQVGLYNFTIAVTDNVGAVAIKAYTWRIAPLSFSYTNLPLVANTLVYNAPYTQPLLVMGGLPPYTFTSTGMPTGLTLNPATGVVTGTPLVTGSVSALITATDNAGGTMTQSINFTIVPAAGTPITFGAGANQGVVQQGFSRTISLSLSGGNGGPYTVTAETPLPPGFAIVSGDALLNGNTGDQVMGTPLSAGTFVFTIKATDSAGNVGARTFTLSVAAFSLINSTLPDGSVGVPYSFPLVCAEGNGPVSWSIQPTSALPPGLSLSSAGLISGTPTAAGIYSVMLNATDASGLVVGFTFSAFRISALAITDPEVLPAVATAGLPFTYTFTATGGGSLVWSATNLPNGLTMSAGGTLSGTPTNTGGVGTPTVTVTDGVVPVSRRFVLVQRTPNVSQFTFSMTAALLRDVAVGQVMNASLFPTGGLGPYVWSVAPGSSLPPGIGLFSGPPNSNPGAVLLTGAPTTAGQYSFDLIVTDSLGSQVRRTFTLRVTSIFILSGTPKDGVAGTAYAQQFVAVGGTPPYTFSMTPRSLTGDMLPPGLTLSAAGLISGTTTSTGYYSFNLIAQDAAGHVFSRPYTLISVHSSGAIIENGNSNDWVLGIGRRFQALSVDGPSTYSWSVVAGALPPGAVLIPDPTTPGGTLLAGQATVAGSYAYTLRATDTSNGSITLDHAFTLRVSPIQVVTPFDFVSAGDLPRAEVGVFYSTTIKAAGGTPPYTFVESPFSPLPPGLTLSSGGVLSGTPTAIGVFTVAQIVSDSALRTVNGANQILTVTSAGAPSPLVAGFGTGAAADASRGAPYAIPLDPSTGFQLVRGGTPPYTWSLASGSSLPPGIALLPGSGSVSAHLGGIPTTSGNYSFSLTVADSAAQTLTVPVTMKVSSLNLTPDSVAPGVVGTSMSVPFTPSGGTPPYVIAASPTFDLPIGLTLSPSGLLSGTPTGAGNFAMQLTVTDGAANTLTRYYRMTVDNALGEAPGLHLSPKPVQIYHVQGASNPTPVSVQVNTTSGALPFELALTGIPGATLSANTGTTSTTVDMNLNMSGVPTGTYAGFLGARAPASANRLDSAPVTLTVAAPPPCTYGLNPGQGSVAAAGGSGTFTVSTFAGCAWTATTANPWITITSGASGTGGGGVGYSVSPNGAPSARSGAITVNGQVYTLTQFGSACSFAISPVTLSATATGGSGFISVTASDATCAWTASGLSAMPSSGTGSGGVTVTIPPSAIASSQVLTATIAGQTLTVNQSGLGCAVSLSPNEGSSPPEGGDGSIGVSILAGCPYDTVLGPTWIHVTSGGSGVGSGTLVYSVEPNSTTFSRMGVLTVGGEPFQLTQQALPCSVTLNTSALGNPFGPAAGIGSIAVQTNGPNCTWTASSTVPWAVVTPLSGTGDGTLFVTVTSNAASQIARAGDLNIAGQTLTIDQAGLTCPYSLQSTTGSVPAAGGSGAVGLVTASICAWTSASNDPAWLTSLSTSGTGTFNVQFVAQPNTAPAPRTGTLAIGGLTYTVTQDGAPCSYTLDQSGITVASTGGSGSFGFSTPGGGCAPSTVLSYAGWISVTAIGVTSGTVNYTVEANPSSTVRQGNIQFGDKSFTVTQSGGACGYSLNAYGAVFGTLGGSSSVLGSPTGIGCTPTVGTDQPSFVFLGPLTGPVSNIFTLPFTVSPFGSLTPVIRRAKITFGGQVFFLKQTSW